jgi:hydrogenase expression/formation protein HypC
MCLGVPGRVIDIAAEPGQLPAASVAFAGVTRPVCVALVPDVRVGEYVLVHAGLALEVIDEQHAAELLDHLKAMGDDELTAVTEPLP